MQRTAYEGDRKDLDANPASW